MKKKLLVWLLNIALVAEVMITPMANTLPVYAAEIEKTEIPESGTQEVEELENENLENEDLGNEDLDITEVENDDVNDEADNEKIQDGSVDEDGQQETEDEEIEQTVEEEEAVKKNSSISMDSIECVVEELQAEPDLPAEEALRGYFEKKLFGMEEMSFFASDMMEDHLQGVNLALYQKAKEQVIQIAAGEESSTQITSDNLLPILKKDKNAWTAEELGLNTALRSTDSKELVNAFYTNVLCEQNGFSSTNVINAIKTDCAYEQFWMSLRSSVGISLDSGSIISYDEELKQDVLVPKGVHLTLTFLASEEYCAYSEDTGVPDYKNVNTAKISKVQEAAVNARRIVDEVSSRYEKDADKIRAYFYKICELTDYNYDALEEGTPYGNPWQVIYVFDKDPETNVVCEGYAKAMAYLCELTSFHDYSIRCYIVDGVMQAAGEGGNHMWNIVHMEDGKNYLVDVTNCDQRTGVNPSLFLVGEGQDSYGSPETGYSFDYKMSNGAVYGYNYTYSSETLNTFTTTELTISREDYSCDRTDILQSDYCGTEGTRGTNIEWQLTGTGEGGYTLTLLGSGEMKDYYHYTSPASGELPPWATNMPYIKRVVVSEGITNIGAQAFEGATRLQEVILPDTLKAIKAMAFKDCTSLEQINLPANLEIIGGGAFREDTSLQSVEIYDKATQIDNNAFSDCTNLDMVTVHSKTVRYGLNNPFGGCTKLTVIRGCKDSTSETFAQKVGLDFEYIDAVAREGKCGASLTWKLTGIEEDNCTLTITGSGGMYDYDQTGVGIAPWLKIGCQIKTIKLSNSIKKIGAYAFAGLPVENVIMPTSTDTYNRLNVIGAGAFANCASLAFIRIANKYCSLDDTAFDGCSALGIVGPSDATELKAYASAHELNYYDETITVNYNGNGGRFSENYQVNLVISRTYTVGQAAALWTNKFENSNYIFDGWNTKADGSGQAYADGEQVCFEPTDTGTVTLYAQWRGKRITLIFHPNGAEGEDYELPCEFGKSVTFPNDRYTIPHRKIGYWCMSADGTEECIETLSILDPASTFAKSCDDGDRIHLYALWEENRYIIFYYKNFTPNGSQGYGIKYSEEHTIKGDIFGRDGYVLTSWNTQTDGSGETYYPGQKVSKLLETGSINLYAQWEEASDTYGACGESASWRITGTEEMGYTLAISGSGETKNYGVATAQPWHAYATKITKIVVGEGITSIGYRNFEGLSQAKEVVLPDSLETIGWAAFLGCSALENLTLPQNVTFVDGYAFQSCSNLKEVSFPDGVTKLGEYSFSRCDSLSEFVVPNSVISIGTGVLCDTPVTKVVVPFVGQNRETTDEKTRTFQHFYGYTYGEPNDIPSSIKTIVITDASRIPQGAFSGMGWVQSIEINEGVTAIEMDAFCATSRLKTFKIPSTVKTVDRRAFCFSGIKNIFIPKNTIVLGETKNSSAPFYNCADINFYCEASVLVNWGSNWDYTSYSHNVILGAKESDYDYWTTLDKDAERIEIPEGVTFVPAGAFSGNDTLEYVSVPSTVKEIQDRAFGARFLKEVEFKPGVTTIGAYAFANTDLVDVKLPNTVISIGACCFADCNSLRNVYIPNSVSTIVANTETSMAFKGSAAAVLWCEGASSKGGWGPYWDCYNIGIENFKVRDVIYSAKEKDYDYWTTLKHTTADVVIPDGITIVPCDAFLADSIVEKITIPNGVRTIGMRAFSLATKLKKVYIPSSVTRIHSSLLRDAVSYETPNVTYYCESSSAQPGWDTYWRYSSNEKSQKVYYNVSPALFAASGDEVGEFVALQFDDGCEGIYLNALDRGMKAHKKGTAIGTLPTVLGRTGYEFLGWYTAAEGGVLVTSATVCSDNTILYAQWAQTHEHDYTGSWKKNSTNHWKACECGETSLVASHSYGSYVVTKEATEEEEGSKYRNCTVCGYRETENIAKLEHQHDFTGSWEKNSTNHWKTCRCGEISLVTAHSYGSYVVTKEATEEEEGSKYRDCTVCGYRETETIARLPHQHRYTGAWLTNQTHHWKTCACGAVVQLDGHTWGNWIVTKNPTETEAGSRYHKCVVCDYQVNETMDKLPHTHKFGAEWKRDTTNHWKTCRCGETSLVATHSFGSYTVTKEATEEEEGSKHRDCTVCGYRETETIARLPHQHRYTEAWLTNQTHHWKTCACGAVVQLDGHTWGNWMVTKNPTETEAGSRYHKCVVCDYQVTETMDKLPHTHKFGAEWNWDNTNHWKNCACGYVNQKSTHIYGEWKITLEPTEDYAGARERICTVCQYKATEPIEKLPHTHTFGRWSVDKAPAGATTEERHRACTKCGYEERETIPVDSYTINEAGLGWDGVSGTFYWYEDHVKQGTYEDPHGVLGDGVVRGREIFDPVSGGWYWLDACYDGAKACNKEVWMPYIYQDEEKWSEEEIWANARSSGDMAQQVHDAIVAHGVPGLSGKWVRYDAYGKMIKGWYTVAGTDALLYPTQIGNTYYYDNQTGLMAKGWVSIEGVRYHFDESTGVLIK